MQGVRADQRSGYVQVRVEPSVRIETGVFVSINDHYDLQQDQRGEVPSAIEAMEIVEEDWEPFLAQRDSVGERVFNTRVP
jgi:hypothetical protein